MAAAVVAAGAIALGWGTASGWGAVVAWLLVPIALPFGEANQFTGGGGTDPVVLLAAVSAAMSTVLIFAAARARVLYNRHRPRRRPARGPRTARSSLDPTSAIDPGLERLGPRSIRRQHTDCASADRGSP